MDKLALLRGAPKEITPLIVIKQPTLEEIMTYGERNYWQLVASLTSSSYDCRFFLDDNGFAYEDVEDYVVFCMQIMMLEPGESAILFGDTDLYDFSPDTIDGEEVLLNKKNGAIINRYIYNEIVEYLRDLHGLKRNWQEAANSFTRRYIMEEERKELEEKLKNQDPDDSSYAPLISALVNCSDFKYDYDSIWGLTIYAFMDSAKQVQKLNNYRNVMTGVYTGNIDSKKLPKESSTWIGGTS